ncbi:MAG: FUSC family protein [Actinomycetota bacterium]|nr:FUSC family protein [Actinomycetota bacterium]
MDGNRSDARNGSARGAALIDLLRTAARLDRTQSDPIVSARNALGVALPLVIGAIAGNAAIGLPATIGALQTAFADRPGPYRLRLLRMATTAATAGLTSTLAVVCSRSAPASALLLLVVGFLAGLALAGGPSAAQVGVAATAAALLLGHQSQRPDVALHVGLLVAAGGGVQVLLAIAAWPLGRHRPERLALGGLYRAMAQTARRPPGSGSGPPLGDQLAAVRLTLYGLGHDHGPSVEAYRVLLDESERVRREVLGLGAYLERLADDGDLDAAGAVREVLGGCAVVLEEIASALVHGRAVDPDVLAPVRAKVARALQVLDQFPPAGFGLTRLAAAARVRSVAGQLRAAVGAALVGASEGSAREGTTRDGAHDISAGVRLRAPMTIVRANLAADSALLRHAIRLGVLVAAADFTVREIGVDRGYWVPLTVLVVLRPDFAATFQRSAMRVIGTTVGLLLATALVHWIPGGQWYSIALVTVFFFGMRLAGPGNLALTAVCLAALVVVLLALAGIAPHTTVTLRGLDTAVGGALALIATLLWPAWERQRVVSRLAQLLSGYRGYTLAVADLTWDPDRIQRTRGLARLVRMNAQASVDRARSEPVGGQAEVELAEAVLVHTHRYIHAVLTIEALRAVLRQTRAVPELTTLLDECAQVLDRCEMSLRTAVPPRPEPRLRTVQNELAMHLTARPEAAGGVESAAVLIDATDRIANSLDTLISELRRQLPARAVLASRQ